MKESKHLYQTGDYRLWLDVEKGYLRMKLDGNEKLYTIEKDSKLYNRLMEDYFSSSPKQEQK